MRHGSSVDLRPTDPVATVGSRALRVHPLRACARRTANAELTNGFESSGEASERCHGVVWVGWGDCTGIGEGSCRSAPGEMRQVLSVGDDDRVAWRRQSIEVELRPDDVHAALLSPVLHAVHLVVRGARSRLLQTA